MSWLWEICSGTMFKPDGSELAKGYSGKDPHKNDWTATSLHNEGPIPAGFYRIGNVVPFTAVHGPHVLPLTPDAKNLMWQRAGFLIHGDSVTAPGTASEGCIILNREARNEISASEDKSLQVVHFRESRNG